ncbi:hypothetical protein HK096_006719 [Nowakowskiella sp. JEL0078]|nr:hypothetical protein HK096_006719 [Nowakowskiella sp. JEL0078]
MSKCVCYSSHYRALKMKTTSVVTQRKLRVAILGAGPAGLATALAIENYGSSEYIEVTILDKNASISDYEGVEYAIQPRACYALERIGVKDEVLKRGNPMQKIYFFDERIQKYNISVSVDPKYIFEVYREEFLHDMEGALKRTAVLRSKLISDFDLKEDGSIVVKTKTGKALDFDLVVSAEGLHSVSRQKYLPEAKIIEHDFQILYFLIEAKPGQEMPEHFMELANGSYLQFNMGKIATNSFFPLGKGRLAIAISFNSKTRKQVWSDCGVEVDVPWTEIDPIIKKKIATIFAQDTVVFDSLFTKLLEFIPDWNSKRIYSWTMRDTDAVSTPFLPNGNLIMIGDAAHAMLPCIGQGASLAIEDGEALGKLIGKFAKTKWTPDTLNSSLKQSVFQPFTRSRYPVWKDLIRRSRHAERNFAGQDRLTGFTVAPYIPNPIISSVVLTFERISDFITLCLAFLFKSK